MRTRETEISFSEIVESGILLEEENRWSSFNYPINVTEGETSFN